MSAPDVAAVQREHGFALVAVLARELRSLDAAEDALQEALVAALRQWPGDPPRDPAAWLLTVARRRARDAARREATLARKLPLLALGRPRAEPPYEPEGPAPAVADDRLRLIFAVCHPALAPEARVALTLRYAGGLTTPEVARLLLVSRTTMAARLTRASTRSPPRASPTACRTRPTSPAGSAACSRSSTSSSPRATSRPPARACCAPSCAPRRSGSRACSRRCSRTTQSCSA